MADKAKGWTIIWTLLLSDVLGIANEEKCQSLARAKSTPVISFCKEDILISNTSMTLDAFRSFFGSISTPCTCEVSIFTTQTTSMLHIQQEPSLLPTSNCGLSMKLTWGAQHSRVVNCNDYLDTEYQLAKGGVLMLTLDNTSPTWSTGFCLAVRLRFELGPLRAKCFSPGRSTIQAMSTPSVTDITSNTFPETQRTTSLNASLTTTLSITPVPKSIQTGKPTLNQVSKTSSILVLSTTERHSSTTERKTATSVTQKVDHITDFNVVYIMVGLMVSVILGILFLVVFLRRRQQRNTRERLDFKDCIQSSSISYPNGADTDSLDMNNKETHHAYENRKEEPNFYYYQDLKIPTKSIRDKGDRLAEAKTEHRSPRFCHNADNDHTREQSRHNVHKVQILHNTPNVNKQGSSVVKVTVNDSKKFIL